jgi:uncharacterized membrane protein
MLDTFLELLTGAGVMLFCLLMLPVGVFVLLGGLRSLRRYWWRENQQHQTLFVIVTLLTVTVTGGFLASASGILLWQELARWLH